VNVGASTIGGNGTGVVAQSGSLISFGNNQMSANGTNGNFTSTTALRLWFDAEAASVGGLVRWCRLLRCRLVDQPRTLSSLQLLQKAAF
jgi:hypothetical protein